MQSQKLVFNSEMIIIVVKPFAESKKKINSKILITLIKLVLSQKLEYRLYPLKSFPSNGRARFKNNHRGTLSVSWMFQRDGT